mgnify:CR=1 FL=1
MNKSLLKFVTDFGPLLIFFYFYKQSGNNLSIAIPPLIISTIIAVIIVYMVERKIPYVPLIGAALISLFGGLTLYFNNPIFIYMKPTIVNLIFAAILLISKSFVLKFILTPVIVYWVQLAEFLQCARYGRNILFESSIRTAIWCSRSRWPCCCPCWHTRIKF